MRTVQRDIVSAVIMSKDGKIFQGRHGINAGGVYSGCWLIPGGGIEKGEDKITALAREIDEEAGIDISKYVPELIHHSRGSSEKILKETGERVFVEMMFYTYKIFINDKIASDISVDIHKTGELAEYHWVFPEELSQLKLSPPSIELFTHLGYLNVAPRA